MNIAKAAVQRPIFTTMVTLIVLILGGVSLLRLPIDLMPDITYPAVSIITNYENASPEIIEELITRRIEQAVSGVPGVLEVKSSSVEGASTVRITFTWGTNVDAAANDVRDYLDRIVSTLPEGTDRPLLRKFDLSSQPILFLGVASNLDPVQLRELVDKQLRYRFERVPGVAAISIRGGRQREIHANMSPDRLKAMGLSLSQIIARIKQENVTLPAGTVYSGNSEVTIRTQGEYLNLEQLRNTVIAVQNGVPVKLREVADVEDAWQKIRQLVRINGKSGVMILLNKQSGTNTVAVAKAALQEMERINQDMPHLHIVPIVDTSLYIQNAIANVGSAAVSGGLLAVLILFIFLRSLRSTVVIATSIPISIIATFTLMYFCGFTLNIMSLGGLALGVGMLVDNSIVVLENIYRLHEEEGLSPHQAAVAGSGEVTAAIVSSTLTTLAVFLPLIFVQGMAGVMFQQLAYVISFSLACSLVVALTLVPMLAAKIMKPATLPTKKSLGDKLFEWSGKPLDLIDNWYKELLQFALHYRKTTAFLVVLAVAASLLLINFIGVELMPTTDESEVNVNVELAMGTQIALVERTLQQIETVVKQETPEVANMLTSIGGSGWRLSSANTGEVRIKLVPISQRTRSSEAIANDLRRKLANIVGATIRVRLGEGAVHLRRGGGDRVQVEVRGHEFETARALAIQVRAAMLRVEGITDIRLSLEAGSPEELVMIDREKAADMQLTVAQIAGALETALSGTSAGNYREGGEEYKILVKFKNAERMGFRNILDLMLINNKGEPVVLRNVVSTKPRLGPVNIERKNQGRIITVSANITGRDMGSILGDVRQELLQISVPSNFSILIAGDYEEQQRSFVELLFSFVLSLVLVYMVMACQYESLKDPLIVMFSVPLAAIGVILVLFLTDTSFSLPAFIGCIMLGGIVVNNAILLVDHTNLLRDRDKMPLTEAIAEAGRRRLRPILMTSLTTILGLLPLAIGSGDGGESQSPLARTVIGGLTTSTFITLIFVPVVYALFAGKDKVAEPTSK